MYDMYVYENILSEVIENLNEIINVCVISIEIYRQTTNNIQLLIYFDDAII